MIRITSIRRCHISNYDDIYLIIRSTASLERANNKLLTLPQVKHLPDLSPSQTLFFEYLNWVRAGEWNQEKFDTDYKPTFETELKNSNAQNWLNKIADDSKNGRKIALLCFCPDENLCHRLIVGKALEKLGCQVIFDKR